MDTAFQRKADSAHYRWKSSGDARDERVKDAIIVIREDLSVGICEPRPECKEGWSHAKMMMLISSSGTNKGQGQRPERAWCVSARRRCGWECSEQGESGRR